jgi:hypothetical protein
MICRSCGASIAEKAIVCYRCGTPTEAPAVKRPPPPPRRPSWAVLLVLLGLVVGLAIWSVVLPEGDPVELPAAVGAALLAAVAVGVGFWRLRRR